jgi:hypothetical protein
LIQEIQKNKKCKAATVAITQRAAKEFKDDITRKVRIFIRRRLSGLGRDRYRELFDMKSDEHDLGCTIVNVNTRKDDEDAKNFLKQCYPEYPEVLVHPDIEDEHAYVDVKKLVLTMVGGAMRIKQYKEAFFWMYDRNKKAANECHIELAYFFDGFEIHGGEHNCTVIALEILNLAGLSQFPKSFIPCAIMRTTETSETALFFLKMFDEAMEDLQENGFCLSFEGFTDGETLVKSSIPLEGTHHFTLRLSAKNDLKAGNFQNGALSCGSTFPSLKRVHNMHLQLSINMVLSILA